MHASSLAGHAQPYAYYDAPLPLEVDYRDLRYWEGSTSRHFGVRRARERGGKTRATLALS